MKIMKDKAFAAELQDLIEKYKRKDIPLSRLIGVLETEKTGLELDFEKEKWWD